MPLRHLAASLALIAGLVFLVSGCGSKRSIPRTADDVPGYHKAPPDLVGVDTSPLRDRRILIDPGHGGYFRGAVGDGGLTEAEVNLGVALYLQGLLQWAGAEVHLTRTVDTDFLSPADSSLAGDLAARVALADSLMPDVFLSIHHNSTASRDPDINETQTYYPIGREGADRDLARAIHRRLVRALEIEPAKILPGGFHVLRNAPVPAVLGEPAMISNPVIEGRLSLARSLELEAHAYFLGLRDYFAAGTPTWVTDWPDTLEADAPAAMATWRFDPGGAVAPPLDPSTVQVTVDDRPVAHELLPGADGVVVAAGLDDGRTWRITGRNLAGRATAERRHVRRSEPVRHWDPAWLSSAATLPATARWQHLHAPRAVWGDQVVPGDRWRRRHGFDPELMGVGDPSWPAVAVSEEQLIWLEADGAVPLLVWPDGGTPWELRREAPADTLVWQPIVPELIGRRIAIDPRGGGVQAGTSGPLGTRGSDLNLRLAEQLGAMLTAAGAEVVLVRDDDLDTPEPTRVARADDFGAELYLALGRHAAGVEVRHHPGSLDGEPWARDTAARLARLLPDTVATRPAYDYVLRHTACPAIVVGLEPLVDAATETRLLAAAWQNAVVRTLLRAVIARFADVPDVSAAELLAVIGERGLPPDRLDYLRLDGAFVWIPPDGQAIGSSLTSWQTSDPGPLPVAGGRHVVELHAGPHWQVWALHRDHDGRWSAQSFLSNR